MGYPASKRTGISKPHVLRAGPALLGLALSLAPLCPADTTIFNDTFDSGIGSWYKAATTGTLANASGQLSWLEGGNSMREVIGRSFPETTLSVGQKIRVTFDYKQNGTPGSAHIIRAGLFNITNPITADNWAGTNAIGAWSGYYTFLRDASATGNRARLESGTTTGLDGPGPTHGGTDIGSNSTNFDIVNDASVTYQCVFEVTYTSSSQMDTLFTLSSTTGEVTTTHFSLAGTTTTVQDTFDMVALKQAGGTNLTTYYDNIKVDIIGGTAPDPAIFADWQEITWPGNNDVNTIGPDADPDGDGIINLLEWALHLIATSPDVFAPTFAKNGANLDFTYTRRKTAPGEATFRVEWSETLANDWSVAGVVEDAPVSINTTSESLHATVPAGPNGRCFIRVRIIK